MPVHDYPEIQNLIDNGYKFNFGDYFSIAGKYFEEHALMILGYFIAYFAITYSVNLIPTVGPMITTLVGPVLLAGVYIYLMKSDRKQSTSFNTFFEGLSYAKDIIPRIVAVSAIVLLAAAPFIYFVFDSGLPEWFLAVSQNPNDSEMIAETFPGFPPAYSLFLLIPVIYIGVCYAWADMFIVLKGMSFWDAMEASRQVINEQWFSIFGFFLLAGLGATLVAVVTCGIGIFLAIPYIFVLNYVAFADVVGLNRNTPEENEDILDHLVD